MHTSCAIVEAGRVDAGVPHRGSGGVGRRGRAGTSMVVKGTQYLDRVESHLHLDAREATALGKQGFVVLERQRYDSYAVAFHDVFQQQLPVYVFADAILNAVYQSSQTLLESAERTRLIPRLFKMLPRMRKTLAQTKDVYTEDEIADLDTYLAVAAGFLDDDVAMPAAATGSGSTPRTIPSGTPPRSPRATDARRTSSSSGT